MVEDRGTYNCVSLERENVQKKKDGYVLSEIAKPSECSEYLLASNKARNWTPNKHLKPERKQMLDGSRHRTKPHNIMWRPVT